MGSADVPVSNSAKNPTKSNSSGRKNKFEGVVIATSGHIPDYKHNEIQAMVEACGAKFEKMKISECTHLITTVQCYQSTHTPAKILAAQTNPNCSVVTMDWLLQSVGRMKPLDAKGFLVKSLGSKRPVQSTGNSKVTITNVRKRKHGLNVNEASGRQAKFAKDRLRANREELRGLIDDASHPSKGKKNLLVWLDEDDNIYDATLVSASSALDDTGKTESIIARIIRVQLTVDVKANKYNTWIRETKMTRNKIENYLKPTKIGTTVSCKGDGLLPSAISEFWTIFEKLTGLNWKSRFEPVQKKKFIFVPTQEDSGSKTLSDASANFLAQVAKAATVLNLATLMESYQNQLMGDKLTAKHSMATGIDLADMISHISRKSTEVMESTQIDIAGLRKCFIELFGDEISPISMDSSSVRKTKERIEDMMSFRAIKAAMPSCTSPKASQSKVSTFGSNVLRFLRLESMELVPTKSKEYGTLVRYYNQSYRHSHVTSKVLNIFHVERRGEVERFTKCRAAASESMSHRRLLWHGSHEQNFASILRNGLRIGPSAGIFFADMSGKSVAYCRMGSGHEVFILLCEVELGRDESSHVSTGRPGVLISSRRQPHGATHSKWVDASCVRPDLAGVEVPLPQKSDMDQWVVSSRLPALEYIVYDPAQIRLRYVFHIKLN
ncbi:hypothetical protein POX_a00246 [Penicillium oxalicum]|uniref:hypothetical protein n=1 Tax=Penicillium oxalicum TaxID=69781 RepID=UPI0020B65CB0|nr:hypothetical protein POX_a00246 [Penicillium oxalicum]KAI2793663.1 hypothetical protein POX_a00246 [Penicillium oxalicum]